MTTKFTRRPAWIASILYGISTMAGAVSAFAGGISPAASSPVDLIACYRLRSDAVDSTGRHTPMLLTNTRFEDSSLFCNGLYILHNTATGCDASTPELLDLAFDSVVITVRFKIDEYPSWERPVFMGGKNYRWLGFILMPDSTILLRYNNSQSLPTPTRYFLNTWHEAKVSYDSAQQSGRIYLDGVLAGTAQFPLIHGENRNISNTNFSNATTFKGWLRDLRIYCSPRGIVRPPLACGPRSGSIPSGTFVSTSPYSSSNALEATTGQVPIGDHPPIALLPAHPTGIAPAALEGANYQEALVLSDSSSAGVSAPSVVRSFSGLPDYNYIPPGQDIAVGPEHIVEVVNCRFRIITKSGTILKTIESRSWFGTTSGSTSVPMEPQIVYDHFAGRWVMIWTYYRDSTATLYLSVSDDNNPLGTWMNWALPANRLGDSVTTTWDDYPQLGFDEQALYLTSDCRTLSGNGFVHSRIKIIGKVQLYANTAGKLVWTDLWDLRDPVRTDVRVSGVQPAVIFGKPGKQFFMNTSPFVPGAYLTLWTLENPLTSPVITALNIPVTAYYPPPNAGQLGGATPLIEANVVSLRSQPVFRNGSLWAVHSVASGASREYSAVRYARFDPFAQALLEDVAMGSQGYWHYCPALTVDTDTNVVVVYNRSGVSEYIGAFVSGRKESDPPGLSVSVPLRTGQASYVKTYTGTRNRWGPHSGISVDPNVPWSVWVVGQYAASPANTWGTYIGDVTMVPSSTALMKVQPSSVSSRTVEVGTAGDTVSVSVINQGPGILTVNSITHRGGHFTVVGMPALPLRLDSAGRFDLRAVFTPSVQGTLRDTLLITGSDPRVPSAFAVLSGIALGIAPLPVGVMVGTTEGVSPQGLVSWTPQTWTRSWLQSLYIESIVGLSVHPVTHQVFGVATNSLSTRLYKLGTLGNTLLVATLPIPKMRAVAFCAGDTLWGATEDGKLYRFLPPFWTGELIGKDTAMIYSSIAFCPARDRLWATTMDTSRVTRDALFNIDRSTGKAALVGRTMLDVVLQSIAFDQSGTLYAVARNTPGPTLLYQIEQANARATYATAVGAAAIAFRNDPVASDAGPGVADALPDRYLLCQNYPNPFNPSTTIKYGLPRSAIVKLSVFDMLGREVSVLVNERKEAGVHEVTFDASSLSSGAYIYRMQAEAFVSSLRLILVR